MSILISKNILSLCIGLSAGIRKLKIIDVECEGGCVLF